MNNILEPNSKINITKLKKQGRYFQATINRDRVIKLHPDISMEYHIYKDAKFSIEEWENIIYKNDFRLAWESALRLLAIRAHCEGDLSIKLQKRKFNKRVIIDVVNEAKRLDFIDDAIFSREYTKELLGRGYGTKMIRSKLMAKALPSTLIDEEIANINSNELELKAAKIAFKKKLPMLKRETDPRKKEDKLFRYLYSKGFSYDIIQQLLESTNQ